MQNKVLLVENKNVDSTCSPYLKKNIELAACLLTRAVAKGDQ